MLAGTGCTLHLIEPFGFELNDAPGPGWTNHDLANVVVHPDLVPLATVLPCHGQQRGVT
ncbi:hypothetical protein OCAE111667_04465 [Occultella aeris]|uniref:Uncharacterized protein n=1 Tax=Occultella aeris TaxID=2761496 RepID=A0A7M4DG21_9MICO|nr:hypothetical protein [Occultella aeris]VZO35864.1 hypothetical protein HALOF300_01066 [Occultella aeris]